MSGSAVAPAVIADAVAAARAWLRAPDGSEEGVLATLARTAIDLAERFCGTALVERAFADVLPAGAPWQRLSRRPVTAITGALALPPGGAPVPLAADEYAIDIDADGGGWVRVLGTGLVSIEYRAGLAAGWADLPVPLTQGVAMLVAHLFDNRASDAAPPAAVAALWRPFRRMRLAAQVHP